MALKTNFTDDILAESMNGKRQYNVTENSNGTKSLEDVTDYQYVGSTFSAKNMNETNAAVNQAYDDMGDEFNKNTKYLAGAVKIHNNKLWKFKVDHDPGEWDESQVRKTTLLDEIGELNENLGKNTFGDKVTLVKDQNYICPSDGYFHVVCGYQEKSRAVGFINDINLVALSSTNSSSVVINNSMASIIFVRAGMTIKYTGTNAQGFFIPLI